MSANKLISKRLSVIAAQLESVEERQKEIARSDKTGLLPNAHLMTMLDLGDVVSAMWVLAHDVNEAPPLWPFEYETKN